MQGHGRIQPHNSIKNEAKQQPNSTPPSAPLPSYSLHDNVYIPPPAFNPEFKESSSQKPQSLLETIKVSVQSLNAIETSLQENKGQIEALEAELKELHGKLPPMDERGKYAPNKAPQGSLKKELPQWLTDIKTTYSGPLQIEMKKRDEINLIARNISHWRSQLDQLAPPQANQLTSRNIQEQLSTQKTRDNLSKLIDQTETKCTQLTTSFSRFEDCQVRFKLMETYVQERKELINELVRNDGLEGRKVVLVGQGGNQESKVAPREGVRQVFVKPKEEETKEGRDEIQEIQDPSRLIFIANIKQNYLASCLSTMESFNIIMDSFSPRVERLREVKGSILKITPILPRIKEKIEQIEQLLPAEGRPAVTNVTPEKIWNKLNELTNSSDWAFLLTEMQARKNANVTVENLPSADFCNREGIDYTDDFNQVVANLEKFKPQNGNLEENSKFLKKTQEARDRFIDKINGYKQVHKQARITLPQQEKEFETYKSRIDQARVLVDILRNSQARVSKQSAINNKGRADSNVAAPPNAIPRVESDKACLIM